MIRTIKVALCLAVLFGSVRSAAQAPADRDWGTTLVEDTRALQEDIAANHPGPLNVDDPGFAERNDAQLELALARSRDARTDANYFFALKEYVSSSPIAIWALVRMAIRPTTSSDPGFSQSTIQGGAIKVRVTGNDVPVPVGAELLGCNGMTAQQHASETLGKTPLSP